MRLPRRRSTAADASEATVCRQNHRLAPPEDDAARRANSSSRSPIANSCQSSG